MSKVLDYNLDNPFLYENGFHMTSCPSRLGKVLAQYEIYKSITHLPGHVLEFGVHKGNSLIRLATYRELLESTFSRKIVGFDTFESFPHTSDEEDNAFIEDFSAAAGPPLSEAQLRQVLNHKHLRNVELIAGNILETLPAFLDNHPALRIAFLHIDVDVYEPSKLILELLADRVVSGGVIVFDDYNVAAGETRAVEEVLGKDANLEKLPISHIPSFVRK